MKEHTRLDVLKVASIKTTVCLANMNVTKVDYDILADIETRIMRCEDVKEWGLVNEEITRYRKERKI